jgi:phosphatidylinositol alpha-mannosyltransferase
MRVALVSPYSWSAPGGVKTHILGLARTLRDRGVEVEIVAPADRPPTFPGVVPVGRTIPIFDNGSVVPVALGPGAVARTARRVRQGGYDVVHLHEPMIPAVCLTALYAATAPLVGTFHMYAARARWYRPFAPLCRHALARLSVRIAVSEAARRHVSRTCPGEYRVIPNGVDVASFQLPAARFGSRLLFIGRPEPRKGLPVLLEAFRLLPERLTLDLAGVGPRELVRHGAALPAGVRARIVAHGRVDERQRAALLAQADVLCVPTLRGESFGLVLAEGMAAGIAIVASSVAGYVDVLREGCGLLVPPGDPVALAEAVARLLADGELRRRLGEAARREVRRYDWSVVGEQVLAVYEEVGRGSGARPRAPRRAP